MVSLHDEDSGGMLLLVIMMSVVICRDESKGFVDLCGGRSPKIRARHLPRNPEETRKTHHSAARNCNIVGTSLSSINQKPNLRCVDVVTQFCDLFDRSSMLLLS